MLTPQQIAEKWKRNFSAASQSVRDGVNNVTVAPTLKAAEKINEYLQGVQEAVASGRFAASLRASPLEKWKRQMLNKGLSAMAAGATEGQAEMAKFMAFWQPVAQQIKDEVARMPKGGEANAKARSGRAIEIAMANRYKGRG